MILVSSTLTVVLLFFLSLLMPVMSFALPIYKIKKMKNFTPKEKLIVNIVVMGIIALINPLLLFFYVGFFLTVEFLYEYFNYRLSNVKKFDRIVVISLVVTLLMGGLLFYIKDDIINNMEYLMEFYEKNFQLSKTESISVFNDMKANSLYYLFFYSILSIFTMYVSLDLNDYEEWKISFEWLLLYIGSYFVIHLLKVNNFFINNLLNIGETIFIFYGIKSIYSILSKKISFKGLNNMIAIMIAILFPFGTFVLGVFEGFKIDKFNNTK